MKPHFINNDIQRRTHFHWENKTGADFNNALSNWLQAETEEYQEWIATPDRPLFPYVIIDQNCLRDEDLIKGVMDSIRGKEFYVLLPDVAIMEMLKNPEWECTMRRSLSLLAKEPEKIKIALGFGEIMRLEKETNQPAVEIEDNLVTPRFRNLLKEIKKGDGPEISTVRSAILDAQEHATGQHLNHKRNKDVFLNLCSAWKETLSKKEINEIKNDKTKEKIIELLSGISMIKTVAMGLQNSGLDRECAQILAGRQSISSFWVTALATSALLWRINNGLENAIPEKITNDYIDLDYVVLGTVSVALVSKEVKVNELVYLMSFVAERKWKWENDLYKAIKTA